MPNNSPYNNTNNSSIFYANGPQKWNPKYKAASAVTNVKMTDGINSLDGLLCSDFTMVEATKSFSVSKYNKIFQFDIEAITSLGISNTSMNITANASTYNFSFINPNNCSSVEARIFAIGNGLSDPGCN